MGVKGRPPRSKSKFIDNEHWISKQLHARHSRTSIADCLKTTLPTLRKKMLNPHRYCTVSDLLIIAGLLNIDFIDVVYSVYKSYDKPTIHKRWFDLTADDIT